MLQIIFYMKHIWHLQLSLSWWPKIRVSWNLCGASMRESRDRSYHFYSHVSVRRKRKITLILFCTAWRMITRNNRNRHTWENLEEQIACCFSPFFGIMRPKVENRTIIWAWSERKTREREQRRSYEQRSMITKETRMILELISKKLDEEQRKRKWKINCACEQPQRNTWESENRKLWIHLDSLWRNEKRERKAWWPSMEVVSVARYNVYANRLGKGNMRG
jgi:hypothetical protein